MKKSTFDFASLQNLYIYSGFTKKKKLSPCHIVSPTLKEVEKDTILIPRPPVSPTQTCFVFIFYISFIFLSFIWR